MAYSIGEIKVRSNKIVRPGDSVDSYIVITETLDTDKYNDITSIENWDIHGISYSNLDITRNGIKLLYDSIGWGSLTSDQKIISSKYFIATVSERNSILSTDEQKNYGQILFKEKNKQIEDTNGQPDTDYGDLIYDQEPSGVDSKLVNVNKNYPRFSEYFHEFSPSVLNTWHLYTLPVDPCSIVIITIDSTSRKRQGGVREVGSSLQRYKEVDQSTSFSMPVRADSNSQIEIYADSGTIVFYLTARLG